MKKKPDAPAEAPEETIAETGADARTAPERIDSAVAAPETWPAVVRSPQGLNLRKGPALSYEVLEVLPDGAEVTALDLPMRAEVPGWRLVYIGGLTEWVQDLFLRLRY